MACAPEDCSEDTEVRACRPHCCAPHTRQTAATPARRASATSGAGVACLGPVEPALLLGGPRLPLQGRLANACALTAAGGVLTGLGPELGVAALQPPGVSAPWPLSVVAALPGLARKRAPAAPARAFGLKLAQKVSSRALAALPSPVPAAAAGLAPDATVPTTGEGPRAPSSAPHAARNSRTRQRAPAGLAAGAAPGAARGVLGSKFSSAPLPGLARPQAPMRRRGRGCGRCQRARGGPGAGAAAL